MNKCSEARILKPVRVTVHFRIEPGEKSEETCTYTDVRRFGRAHVAAAAECTAREAAAGSARENTAGDY